MRKLFQNLKNKFDQKQKILLNISGLRDNKINGEIK